MRLSHLALSVALVMASQAPTPARADEPPAPAASAPPFLPTSSLGNVPALVTGGLAVVALGTGAVFGILALQDHDSFQSNPSADLANRGESRGLTADMCFGGAATLAVASLVMYLTHDSSTATPEASEAPRVSLAPVVSPHGGGAGAVFRF